jgi:hypothetical protein
MRGDVEMSKTRTNENNQMDTKNETVQMCAVLSRERYDFFLAGASEAFSADLSGHGGEQISLEGRYVQWLPPTSVASMSPADVKNIARSLQNVGGLVANWPAQSNHSAAAIASMIKSDVHTWRHRFAAFEDSHGLDEGIAAQALSRVTEFEREFFLGHRIAFDRFGDSVYCFEVGLQPKMLLRIPILADTGTANSGEKIAKEIALAVALILELLDFIGMLIGLPPNTAKVADKVGKWLEDVKVLRIIREFLDGLKSASNDGLFDLVRRLTTDLWDLGLKETFKEAFAITGWGLVWLLLTFLSYLIPGSAALKVIQFVARVAGLVAKVYSMSK